MILKVSSHSIKELYRFTEVNKVRSQMFNRMRRVICSESTLILSFLKAFKFLISSAREHSCWFFRDFNCFNRCCSSHSYYSMIKGEHANLNQRVWWSKIQSNYNLSSTEFILTIYIQIKAVLHAQSVNKAQSIECSSLVKIFSLNDLCTV